MRFFRNTCLNWIMPRGVFIWHLALLRRKVLWDVATRNRDAKTRSLRAMSIVNGVTFLTRFSFIGKSFSFPQSDMKRLIRFCIQNLNKNKTDYFHINVYWITLMKLKENVYETSRRHWSSSIISFKILTRLIIKFRLELRSAVYVSCCFRFCSRKTI